jgi:predicted DNA-binding protein
MAEPRSGGVKTLAIRLPDELHAQLVLIAQLDGVSLTDAIRQAIEGLIERKRAEGDLAARAEQALAEIERETTARREAIQALFGQASPPDQPASRQSRRRESGSSS